MDDGRKESVRIPPLSLERDGLQLKVHGLKSTLVTVGLLAGISEASEENLALLDHFLARFKEGGVQIIAVVGGLGTEAADVDGIVRKLATAPVPILLVPGAEENFDIFRKTIAKYHKQVPQLVDMTRVRRVQVGRLTLISMPGYRNPYYLSAKERGCSYTEEDLAKTAALLDEKGPNVLLSPTPPLGKGVHATDRTRGQINIGDPALARILAEHNVPFGLFGYAYEAAGHAVTVDGAAPVQSGIWSESLLLQAGAANAVSMSLTGEGRASGTAQIVSFSADRARFQTLDAPARQPW